MQINFEKMLFIDMKHEGVPCKTKITMKFKVMNVLTIITITVIVGDNSQSLDVMTIRCFDGLFNLIIKWFTATTKLEK